MNELLDVYCLNVFQEKNCSNSLSDYTVRLKSKSNAIGVIRFSVYDLLSMKSESLYSYGKINMEIIDLDTVKITEKGKETMIYIGFHKMREIVRYKMRKKYDSISILSEIEGINKSLVFSEFENYLRSFGERKGFAKYFAERFPVKSKGKYGGSIDNMFDAYEMVFHHPAIPKEVYYEEYVDFRTKEKWDGSSYVYPIKNRYPVERVSYKTKAIICVIYEILNAA